MTKGEVIEAHNLSPKPILSDSTKDCRLNTGSEVEASELNPEKKARVMHNFEAAEDDELPLTPGEVICVLNDSNPYWWLRSSHQGRGLFPAN